MGAVRPFFCAMKLSVKKMSQWAILAALYAAITLLTASFAFGPVQFRMAEALSVLCCFAPHLGVGVTLGCLLANLFSTVSALDIVVGTLATALACLMMAKCKHVFLMILPNVILNGLFIGAMLAYLYTPTAFWQGFLINGAQVALGELAVMVLLGAPLFLFLRKNPRLLQKLQ